MKLDLLEAINKHKLATSKGLPMVPRGVLSFKFSIVFSSRMLFMLVLITPGAMQLTLIFDGPNYFANAFVNPIIAALVVE